MAALAWKLLLFSVVCLIGKAPAKFRIVDPFPENIYPIEFTSAKVTCVAADPDDPSIKPSAIKFMRKSRVGNYVELTSEENLSFTNKTEEDGSRLSVTMYIANVTRADDSVYGILGRYECHAFADGVNMSKDGFSVNVITKSEIPIIVVPEPATVNHNDNITLTCNMTERGNQFATVLTRISWYKDGEILETVRNPDPSNPEDTVGPLELKEISIRDGGNYLCLLQVKLRNFKPYNVTAETTIYVRVSFPSEESRIVANVGDTVRLACSAQGYPMTIQWKKLDEEGENGIVIKPNDRFTIKGQCDYCHSVLEITDLSTKDSGNYSCSAVEGPGRQVFMVEVKTHDTSVAATTVRLYYITPVISVSLWIWWLN